MVVTAQIFTKMALEICGFWTSYAASAGPDKIGDFNYTAVRA
jgi:hypothetical protein